MADLGPSPLILFGLGVVAVAVLILLHRARRARGDHPQKGD